MSETDGINIADEVARLTVVADKQLRATYGKLTPWQKTLVARHPDRPKAGAYLAALVTDFTPLAGDRAFADDAAVLGGLGRFHGRSVVVLGTEKGSDTDSRVRHNFGMARPEGYRKARRLIQLAGRFDLPVLSFVDTSGAFPGIEAEARGQAEAIARSIEACLEAPVPVVSTIIGEGGSGGALAISVGDQVLMLQYSVYSVISPEGCASILWKTSDRAQEAADALGITAHRLKALGLVDKIVNEPVGGSHRDHRQMAAFLKRALNDAFRQVGDLSVKELLARRYDRLQSYGRFADTKADSGK